MYCVSTEKELPTLGVERGRSRFPEGVTFKMSFRRSVRVHQVQREWRVCLLDEVEGCGEERLRERKEGEEEKKKRD